MQRFRQYLNEATSKKFVYHVTFTKNAKKIMAQGLKPLQTSNWGKGADVDRYNTQGGVFAFEHPEDAFRWAFKQNWEFKKPVSIIKMKRGKSWEVDPSEDPTLQMGKGKALQSTSMIKSSDMLQAYEFADFGNPGSLGIPQDEWIKGIVKTLTEAAKETIIKNPKVSEIFGALNPENHPEFSTLLDNPKAKYVYKIVYDTRTDNYWVAWAGGNTHDQIAAHAKLFHHDEIWPDTRLLTNPNSDVVVPIYMNLKTKEVEISVSRNELLGPAKKMITGKLEKLIKSFKVTPRTYVASKFQDFI